MGTHPNAILMLVFTPDDLARKTYRTIMEENGGKIDDDQIKIGEHDYHAKVMESDYEDGYQISAPEGSLIFHDFLTYGYGDVLDWDKAQSQKDVLEEFGKMISEKYKGSFKIQVTANYW
jgi:hypothetical protein